MAGRKPKREKKNVVLFLVEGPSDRRALYTPFAELITVLYAEQNYQVFFCCQRESEEDSGGGDITSDSFVNPGNIERKISDRFFKASMERNKYYARDLVHVIQIVDTDGTFLAPDRVVSFPEERASREKAFYNAETQLIECRDPVAIRDRNERKAENLRYLVSLSTIKIDSKQIPYSVFYFSSNLDHFINYNANVEGGKVGLADAFASNYEDDTEGFCRFFCTDVDSTSALTYEESWGYIQQGTNSIHRGTNISILIEMIKSGRL